MNQVLQQQHSCGRLIYQIKTKQTANIFDSMLRLSAWLSETRKGF